MRSFRVILILSLLVGTVYGIWFTTVRIAPDTTPPPEEVWARLYANRPSVTIKSAKLTYLRRVTTTAIASESSSHSSVIEAYDSPVLLDRCVFDEVRYLRELREYKISADTRLEDVDFDSASPVSVTYTWWDGSVSRTLTETVGEDPHVTISSTPLGLGSLIELGRGSDRMPAPDAWVAALRAMGKDMKVTKEMGSDGLPVFLLTVGNDGEPGYGMELKLSTQLDYSVLYAKTVLDGIVIKEEEHKTFEHFDGLYFPRRSVFYTYGVEDGTSALVSWEEFLRLEPVEVNVAILPEELVHVIPKEAVIVDLRNGTLPH